MMRRFRDHALGRAQRPEDTVESRGEDESQPFESTRGITSPPASTSLDWPEAHAFNNVEATESSGNPGVTGNSNCLGNSFGQATQSGSGMDMRAEPKRKGQSIPSGDASLPNAVIAEGNRSPYVFKLQRSTKPPIKPDARDGRSRNENLVDFRKARGREETRSPTRCKPSSGGEQPPARGLSTVHGEEDTRNIERMSRPRVSTATVPESQEASTFAFSEPPQTDTDTGTDTALALMHGLHVDESREKEARTGHKSRKSVRPKDRDVDPLGTSRLRHGTRRATPNTQLYGAVKSTAAQVVKSDTQQHQRTGADSHESSVVLHERTSRPGSSSERHRARSAGHGHQHILEASSAGTLPDMNESASRAERSERRGKGSVKVPPDDFSAMWGRQGNQKMRSAPSPSGLFGRKKLVMWPEGVAPSILYAREEEDDGNATHGMVATRLARISPRHDGRDLVYEDSSFTIRVVGSYVGQQTASSGGSSGVNISGTGAARCSTTDRIVYSMLHVADYKRTGAAGATPPDSTSDAADLKTTIHYDFRNSPRQTMKRPYAQVQNARSLAYTQQSRGTNPWIAVRFALALGSRLEQRTVDADARWLLSARRAHRDVRGASLLRFGYYFFLAAPCSVRLFTQVCTPEHVLLVARRASDGRVDDDATRGLSYVVVRVSES